METSLPTPMTARVYVNLPEGKFSIHKCKINIIKTIKAWTGKRQGENLLPCFSLCLYFQPLGQTPSSTKWGIPRLGWREQIIRKTRCFFGEKTDGFQWIFMEINPLLRRAEDIGQGFFRVLPPTHNPGVPMADKDGSFFVLNHPIVGLNNFEPWPFWGCAQPGHNRYRGRPFTNTPFVILPKVPINPHFR